MKTLMIVLFICLLACSFYIGRHSGEKYAYDKIQWNGCYGVASIGGN
jgi:hypothetical protein